MRRAFRRRAALVAIALPFLAAAQPAPATSASPAATPATPSLSLSGWLALNTYYDAGTFNPSAGFVDQPMAVASSRGSGFGMSVKQTRLRLSGALPSDALLGGAALTGLLETDFAGGYANSDLQFPLARVRHAWIAATWAELGNLTVRVGQDWGLLQGPALPISLGHMTTPRFTGAGYLLRRTPQIRAQGELGGAVGFAWAAAVMPNGDRQLASDKVGVGFRSGLPDFEARAAAVLRSAGRKVAEVGLSGHYGEERWTLDGLAGTPDRHLASQAVALDYRLDAGWVSLTGAAFTGENLDVLYSGVGTGVNKVTVSATDAKLLAVTGIRTKGLWSQLVVAPLPWLQLLAGYGLEVPRGPDLGADALFRRNQQLSTGVVASAGRWKVGLELTAYRTRALAGDLRTANQVEASTLYAF